MVYNLMMKSAVRAGERLFLPLHLFGLLCHLLFLWKEVVLALSGVRKWCPSDSELQCRKDNAAQPVL